MRRARIKVGLAVLGAVFLMSAPGALANTYHPNKLGDHTPNGCTHHDCTLREAITKANHHPGPDTVVLRGGKTYKLSLPNAAGDEDANATGDLDVLGSLVIESSNKKRAAVSARQIDRVLEIPSSTNARATLERIALRGGLVSSDPGGGIQAEGGPLRLVRSRLIDNRAAAGGGLFTVVPTTIIGSSVAGNHALGIGSGGGIESLDSLKMSNSSVKGNAAGFFGGGINASGGPVRLVKTTIAGNSVTNKGGAGMYTQAPTVIVRSTLRGNNSDGSGGGIEGDGSLTVNRSVVRGNRAQVFGGGIDAVNGSLKVVRSTVAANHTSIAFDGGGGIATQVPAIISRSTVSGNRSGHDGGGILVYLSGGLTMANDTVANNQAVASGGGIAMDSSGTASLNNVTIARNVANSASMGGGDGGGIFQIQGTFTVANSLIALNDDNASGDPNCSGTFVSSGHNLRTTSDLGCSGFNGPVDLVKSNPRIGSLANNGGPTKTIALLRHSPAINKADPATAEARDQRGVKRHNPDIGAFERR